MLDSKVFNFSFFLGGIKEVDSLHDGAIKNGGATLFKDGCIYSNIEAGEYINVNNGNNKISIYVPSTIDVNTTIDNSELVFSVVKKLTDRYSLKDIYFYNTNGSWYSESLNEVIIEKITIVELTLNNINELDVKYFVNIANYLKKEMKQEGISIQINDSLAIV